MRLRLSIAKANDSPLPAPNPAQVARDLRSAIREAETLLAELECWLGPTPTPHEAWTASLPRPGEVIPGLTVRG